MLYPHQIPKFSSTCCSFVFFSPSGRVALRGITRLVRSRSDDENFEASWALVVKWKIETWDYVMMQQDLERGLLVQAALFCDDKHASCYVVYSYGDQTHIRVARGRPNKVGAVGWMRSPERFELQHYLLNCQLMKKLIASAHVTSDVRFYS